MAKRLSKEFLLRLRSITGKRSRIVVDHILKHGFITTEDLKNNYGYDHPPRARQDVIDQGIPIETYYVKSSTGRRMAAYRFGDVSKMRGVAHTGRKAHSKKFKQRLIELSGGRCGVCMTRHEPRYLQIDHRVPYQVAGEVQGEPNPSDFMLICGSCNRAKSWSCEHCENWLKLHNPAICQSCYWASPSNYSHIARIKQRRLELVWSGPEVPAHNRIAAAAEQAAEPLPEFVKAVLRKAIPPASR